MTEKDPSRGIRDCGADVAAYALGALDAVEAEAFERHLKTCAVCRDELAAFQQIVDAISVTAPRHPAPDGLRQRVLREVEQESKLRRRRERRERSRRLLVTPSIPRPALALAAVAAIAVVAVGGVEIGTSGTPLTKVYAASVTGSGSAEITVSGTRAELVVRHVAPPPPGHIYEVWLERSGHAPAPTDALFSVTTAGDGDVAVPGDLRGVAKVLVTPEPAGGTRVPTHAPVISVDLT